MQNHLSFLSSFALCLAAMVGCGQLSTSATPNPDAPGGSTIGSGANTSAGSGSPAATGGAVGGSLAAGGGDTAGLGAGGTDEQAGGACGCAPDEPELDPIRITGGKLPNHEYWDLTVVGLGLEDHDGKAVTVRIGRSETEERLGSGQALVEYGTFELSFPKVWEPGIYKTKLVYIDVNEDGTCTPDADAVFSNATASEFHVLTVTPDFREVPASFWPSDAPELDCEALDAPWPAD